MLRGEQHKRSPLDAMANRQPTNEDLGRAIRELRRSRGMTLEVLAAAAGMHVTYLSRVERAHSSPTWEKLVGLAHALDVPVSAIATAAEAQAGAGPSR